MWYVRKGIILPTYHLPHTTYLGDGTMSKIRSQLRKLWEYMREVAGENDYARYRMNTLARGQEPLSPQEFYLQQLQRRYSRISHCC